MIIIKSGIYKINNNVSGKSYIGSAANLKNRFNEHKSDLRLNKHSNPHLQNSYNKYGKENFVFSVIEYVEDENNLIEREQFWINTLKVLNRKYGYNIAPIAGSTLGLKHSSETKKKISEALMGRTRSMETKQKISNTRKGKYMGNKHPMFGRIQSFDTRKKISESKRHVIILDGGIHLFKCPHCGFLLEKERFHKNKGKFYGINSWCSDCCNKNRRKRPYK